MPEKTSSGIEALGKWQSLNMKALTGVWDAVLEIQDAVPESFSAEVMDGVSAKSPAEIREFLDRVERAVTDDAFWEKLPETLVPSASKQQRIDKTMQGLASASKEHYPEHVIKGVGDTAKQGSSRDKLRQYLQETLKDSQ